MRARRCDASHTCCALLSEAGAGGYLGKRPVIDVFRRFSETLSVMPRTPIDVPAGTQLTQTFQINGPKVRIRQQDSRVGPGQTVVGAVVRDGSVRPMGPSAGPRLQTVRLGNGRNTAGVPAPDGRNRFQALIFRAHSSGAGSLAGDPEVARGAVFGLLGDSAGRAQASSFSVVPRVGDPNCFRFDRDDGARIFPAGFVRVLGDALVWHPDDPEATRSGEVHGAVPDWGDSVGGAIVFPEPARACPDADVGPGVAGPDVRADLSSVGSSPAISHRNGAASPAGLLLVTGENGPVQDVISIRFDSQARSVHIEAHRKMSQTGEHVLSTHAGLGLGGLSQTQVLGQPWGLTNGRLSLPVVVADASGRPMTKTVYINVNDNGTLTPSRDTEAALRASYTVTPLVPDSATGAAGASQPVLMRDEAVVWNPQDPESWYSQVGRRVIPFFENENLGLRIRVTQLINALVRGDGGAAKAHFDALDAASAGLRAFIQQRLDQGHADPDKEVLDFWAAATEAVDALSS